MPKQGESQETPTPDEGEARVNFTARVRESVRRRARLYAAANDISLQDLADEALDEYLRRHNA